MPERIEETGLMYSKSNVLILSKYEGTLLENKIFSYALSQIKDPGENKDLSYTFTASELRRVTGSTSGSFYNKLKPVAQDMAGRVIGVENPDTQSFEYFPLIKKAKYENGEFTITFHEDMRQYYTNITANFTKLNLLTMMDFKHDYSFRLYELLKSYCYHPKGSVNKGDFFTVEFGLSELKFIIGVVDANSKPAKDYLSSIKNPTKADYDVAIEKVYGYEKTYSDWTGFKRRVIDPAIKEINEKTEVSAIYETSRSGRGGRIDGLKFTMTLQKEAAKATTPDEMTDEQKDEVIDYVLELMAEAALPIKIKDAGAIAKAGDYNRIRIKNSFWMMQGSKNVEDPVGFIISACKEKYVPSKAQVDSLREQGIINVGGVEKRAEFTQMSIPFEIPE